MNPLNWPPEYIERAKNNPVKIKGFWDDSDKEMEKLGIPKIKETESDSENRYVIVFRPFEEKIRKERRTEENSEKEIDEAVEKGREKLDKKLVNSEGKYKVLGIDKFCSPLDENANWVEGEYDTPEEAVRVAEGKTTEAKRFANDNSMATVYYAYDPNGNYLGGDTWKPNEKGLLRQEK